MTAAGNDARCIWYGAFSDPVGDGWHSFTPDGAIVNYFPVYPGNSVTAFLRWDDSWAGADCDLDLWLAKYDPVDEQFYLLFGDELDQDGTPGSTPFAVIETTEATVAQSGVYALAVAKNTCAASPDWMQLIAWINDELAFYSDGHHMSNPEESRNPGQLAVGATHYWNTNIIAPYSNRGPTIDGRTKPEITGVACGQSASYSPVADDGGQCWFRGTSQSAPHVAGLASLVRQRFPDYNPNQVARYLQEHAADRGASGPDNTWGHGLATLPETLDRSDARFGFDHPHRQHRHPRRRE